jgi:xanthine dehydrogenase YagT iron-sulfur-binding subunit
VPLLHAGADHLGDRLHEGHAGSDAEIREYISGNLCRCAAYPHIVKAINQAKGEIRG